MKGFFEQGRSGAVIGACGVLGVLAKY